MRCWCARATGCGCHGSAAYASGTSLHSARSTLTALAGAPSDVPAGMWASIRTGDIDGDDKDEVLFLPTAWPAGLVV